jgi:hypothetical protein
MDIISGILGGVHGGASAVSELSDERRRELAERVKEQALEAIMRQREQRGFAHDKEMQQRSFTHAEGQQRANIQGREQLQDAQLKSQAELQTQRLDRTEGMQTQRLDSAAGLLGQRLAAQEADVGAAGSGEAEKKPKITTKDYHKQTNDIYNSLRESGWSEGEEIPQSILKQINELRSDAGKPPLVPRENQEKVPGKHFWSSDTTSTSYQYDDGVLPPPPGAGGQEASDGERDTAGEAKKDTSKGKTDKLDWKQYLEKPGEQTVGVPDQAGANQTVETKPPPPQNPEKLDEVSAIAMKLGVDPNAIGKYKKRIWEKLSERTKAQYGSYENFAKMVK